MYTDDYILRMINQAVAVLAKVMGLHKEGKNQEALVAIDQALEGLIGFDAYLIKQLDDNGLQDMLTFQGEVDTDRMVVVGDLFRVRGDTLASLSEMRRRS
jgi:hypothetical protein